VSARYCAACGAPLPQADPLQPGHPPCLNCGAISYRNPVVHAACVVPGDGGPALLYSARVESGETIQAAALRALGVGAEPRMALYCTLTDLQLGAVFLVFRLRERAAGQLPAVAAVAGSPRWAGALCERLMADAAAGRMPVYTARFDGEELDLAEVLPDNAPLSPGPA
jgi:hypothetical protein